MVRLVSLRDDHVDTAAGSRRVIHQVVSITRMSRCGCVRRCGDEGKPTSIDLVRLCVRIDFRPVPRWPAGPYSGWHPRAAFQLGGRAVGDESGFLYRCSPCHHRAMRLFNRLPGTPPHGITCDGFDRLQQQGQPF